MNVTKHQQGVIEYYQSGEHPKLLLISGMHGNEYDVIGCVKQYVEENEKSLPDFLYIPHLSPSAVEQKSRLNGFGHDVNRSFLTPPPDSEIASCMEILSPHEFDACLDFHEDPDRQNEFYLYDTGILQPSSLATFNSYIRSTGAELYNGLDDPEDATLGHQVTDGYVHIPIDASLPDTGFSSGWFLRHKLVKRSFTFEIPGKSPIGLKNALVSTIFAYFLPLPA